MVDLVDALTWDERDPDCHVPVLERIVEWIASDGEIIAGARIATLLMAAAHLTISTAEAGLGGAIDDADRAEARRLTQRAAVQLLALWQRVPDIPPE
jgi:hypothetical protein